MPIMSKAGRFYPAGRKPGDARPCEWCGAPLVAQGPPKPVLAIDDPRYLTHPTYVDGGRADFDDPAVIYVTLCGECIHIIAVMGDDEIREMPEG